MNTEIKQNHAQAQFWTLLGPVIFSCIFFVISIRTASTSWVIPLAALSGLFICHYWKWKGLLLSLTLLIVTMGYTIYGISSEDWLWTTLLSMSLLAALVVTSLSLDETSHAWESLCKENDDHLGTITLINDRLQQTQNKYQHEHQELLSKIDKVKGELDSRDKDLKSSERLIGLVRDELKVMYDYQEKLMQELYDERQEKAALQLRIEEQIPAQLGHAEKDHASEFKDLKHILDTRENEILGLKNQLEMAINQHHLLQKQVENYSSELAALCHMQQNEKNQFNKAQQEQRQQQVVIEELKDHIETLSREKKLLETTLGRLQGELEGLSIKEQQLVREHESTLQALKLESVRHQEKIKYEEIQKEELKASFEERELMLNLQIEEMSSKISMTHQQLLDWQQKVKEYAEVGSRLAIVEAQLDKDQAEKIRLQTLCEKLMSDQEQFEKEAISAKSSEEELNKKIGEMTRCYEELKPIQDQWHQANTELEHFKSLQNEYESLNDQLASQKILCTQLASEKESISQQLHEAEKASLVVPMINSEDNREKRRWQGLYSQLRDQFAEKSALLDKTRRELFHSQEQLTALQKEIEELRVYDESEVERRLCDLLMSTEKELDHVEEEHSSEVDRLHDLIHTLVTRQ